MKLFAERNPAPNPRRVRIFLAEKAIELPYEDISLRNIDMWIRRVQLMLMQPPASFWIHAHPLTAALATQFKDFVSQRPSARA